MKELKLTPGPKIGALLDVLLAEVIDDPKLNSKEKLLERARELKIRDIREIREIAKRKIEEEREEEDEIMKGKYWVK